jgi:hypothetical protein
MPDTERKWLLVDPRDGIAYGVSNDKAEAEGDAPSEGCEVVEYVPAEQLQGAVKALTRIAHGDGRDGSPVDGARAEQIARETLKALNLPAGQ